MFFYKLTCQKIREEEKSHENLLTDTIKKLIIIALLTTPQHNANIKSIEELYLNIRR